MIFILQIIGLAVLFTILSYTYWRIWGHKLKNKTKLLFFLESSYNTIFWTILICNIVNLLVTILLDLKRISTVSVSYIVCLLLLIIPRILISCLKTNIHNEEEKEEK